MLTIWVVSKLQLRVGMKSWSKNLGFLNVLKARKTMLPSSGVAAWRF